LIRLAISAEGPTEREFCREIIRPHLLDRHIDATPIVVTTKKVIDGPNHKGGSISIDRIRNEVRELVHSFDYVTTLYDFYGFIGRQERETADQLCARIAAALENPRNFIPYLQVYEFEALIFSEPAVVGSFLESEAVGIDLRRAVDESGSPERVNDSPETSPAKRLTESFSGHLRTRYDKTYHGPLLALEIGLPAMRASCPRFASWLARLETLPNT